MVIWLKKEFQYYIIYYYLKPVFSVTIFPKFFIKKSHTPSLIFHEYFSVFVIQEDGSVFYHLASNTLFHYLSIILTWNFIVIHHTFYYKHKIERKILLSLPLFWENVYFELFYMIPHSHPGTLESKTSWNNIQSYVKPIFLTPVT